MIEIEVICMLYNASKYVLQIDKDIRSQRKVKLRKIYYYVTESEDNTVQILDDNNMEYVLINKDDFSHSLTREKALYGVNSKYAIMLSQDIKFSDELCLYKLVRYMTINDLSLGYLRQVSNFGMDKYFRMVNYPKKSHVYNDLSLGLDSCFCSDACACYNIYDFKRLNGYGKDLNTNEDMYYAYKCLINGRLVGYCSGSFIYHEHRLSLGKVYRRYVNIGVFLRQNKEILKLKSNKKKYLKIIILLIKDINIYGIIRFPLEVVVRFLGLYVGKRQDYDN